jgi:hypothetical protein
MPAGSDRLLCMGELNLRCILLRVIINDSINTTPIAIVLCAKTPKIAACCPKFAQPALPQAVRRASITEVKKNGLPYRLIALTAPFSLEM